jgi:hypothetical protein
LCALKIEEMILILEKKATESGRKLGELSVSKEGFDDIASIEEVCLISTQWKQLRLPRRVIVVSGSQWLASGSLPLFSLE